MTGYALLFVFALPLSAGAAVATVHKDFSAAGITRLAAHSVDGDVTITPGAAATFHSVSGEQDNRIINDPAAGLKINVETTSGDLTLNSK